jgi:hypothetical protein
MVRFRPTSDVPPERVGRDLSERQRAILAMLHRSSEGAALKVWGLAASTGHGRGARWLCL